MAQPGLTLSPAAEEKLDQLLQMMKEINAMLATWSSAPSPSPTSPASPTPTAATAVTTPPSAPARTAATTLTTAATMLDSTDAPAEPTTALTPMVDNDDRDVSEIHVPLSELLSSASDDLIPDEVTQAPPLDNDLVKPHRAMATCLHLVCPDGVPKELRRFVSELGITFVGSYSAHENHIQEQHVKMVVPVGEDGVSSTLPYRCLMNCLTIIQRCFSSPFKCRRDGLLCWECRPWPPPSKLRWVSCEHELRPLPWPSFDMVERFAVTSPSVCLWKPPWYVNRELTEFVELWKCLMRTVRIVVPVLLGMCLLNSEVMTASMLSMLELVHGSCTDSGVSSVHILVHPIIAYQPWCPDPIVIDWKSGASKTYLKICRSTDMLIPGSSITTISTMRPSSAGAVGRFQYAHQVFKVISTSSYSFSVNDSKFYNSVMLWPPPLYHRRCYSAPCVFDRGKSSKGEFMSIVTPHGTLQQAGTSISLLGVHSLALPIELKPWPDWHRPLDSLIVALICPHLSIMIWVQFSFSLHKFLLWPLHCESRWKYCADCLQLLESARQVDSIEIEAIGLNQLHIAIPLWEVCCLLFTYYHQLVEWKPLWISLKDINSLLTNTCLLCLQSGQLFGNGQLDVLLRQPLPSPLLSDLMRSDGLLKSTPWPSFSESTVAVHLQNSSTLLLAISLTTVQILSVWQEVSSRTLDSIYLVLTLCSHTGGGMLLLSFPFSQYAYLLLHSRHWCFSQLRKKTPWPCQDHIQASCSESVVQLFLRPLPVHVVSVTIKHLLLSVLRWQQKCDGLIKWNNYFLWYLIIIWSTPNERRAANYMRHESCYYFVVWGGPVILIFASSSGHLLGDETLLLDTWLVHKWHHSHNSADASFPKYLIGLNAILLFNGHGNYHLYASELCSILMQSYHSWLSLSERKYVEGNSVMLQFLMATCMTLSPVNYNNHSNNGSVFHRWLIFVPVVVLLRLSCCKPRSSAGKLLLIWAEPYFVPIGSSIQVLYLCTTTQHHGLLYSGRPALLPFISSSLLAWCDNEELEHDKIILLDPQVANFVGLHLHLLVFGLTDFHANEADQSYFCGASEAIYSEWYTSPFILPTAPVTQLQAFSNQNSKTMEVMYNTLIDSSMLALQFYTLMIEDP